MVVVFGDFLATGGLTEWFSCAVVISVFPIENRVRKIKPATHLFISFLLVMTIGVARLERGANLARDHLRYRLSPARDGFPSCARSGRTGAPGRAGRGRPPDGTARNRPTSRDGAALQRCCR